MGAAPSSAGAPQYVYVSRMIYPKVTPRGRGLQETSKIEKTESTVEKSESNVEKPKSKVEKTELKIEKTESEI